MKGRGLEVLEGGMVLEVSPAKIPRIIGRRGSMINMINDHLRIDTVVGQNGRIWIKTSDVQRLRLGIKAFKMIEEQAHTSNLTDRINKMLAEEVALLSGSEPSEESSEEMEIVEEETPSEQEATEEVVVPEPEPMVAVEVEPAAEPEAEAVEEEKEEAVEEKAEPEASADVETESDDKPETEEVK
jgi:exosome complex component RRP4